jgi:nitrogen-specific signal transduction histidine kinase
MDTPEAGPPAALEDMRKEIRRICHDVSNPLGILRMAVYFLQSSKKDPEKRAEYYVMMNESLDKLEGHLKRLRSLAAGGPQPRE